MFKKELIAIFFIIIIVLIGYHEVFLGANFFTNADPPGSSHLTYRTPINGWRPDIRFGGSLFLGDPGESHPWSLTSLFEKIPLSQKDSYSFLVILLGICTALSLYFFLRQVVPELGRYVAILAPLSVFCQEQFNSQHARLRCTLSVGVPLFLMLLYSFYKKPRLLHYFFASLLFWFVAFMGTLWGLTQMLTIGVLFSILYTLYFKEDLRLMVIKFFSIYILGNLTMICLGMWVFYSFFWEYIHIEYMREKIATFPSQLHLLPSLYDIFELFIRFLYVEWLPINLDLPGIPWRPLGHFFNALMIMPLITVFFIFHRSKNFWEYALKWLVILIVAQYGLVKLFPFYGDILAFISHKSSTIINTIIYEGGYFPLQIGLIAIFLSKASKKNSTIKKLWASRIQTGIAYLLITSYFCLLLFALISILLPELIPTVISYVVQTFGPQHLGNYSNEFLIYVVSFIIRRLQHAMSWHAILFYVSSILLVALFIKNKWFLNNPNKQKVLIPSLLLLNGIMFSWTVYPLNYEKLFFEKHAPHLPNFKPTDRFYYTGVYYKDLPGKETIEKFKENWVNLEGQGDREYLIGEFIPPSLNLSTAFHFIPTDVGNFIFKIFNVDKTTKIRQPRELSQGPFVSSELLDMGAVNHYYSRVPIPDLPKNLSLIYKGKQLYIYKNLSAWPYFYLAKNLKVKTNSEYPHVQQNTAYIEKKEDFFSLSKEAGKARLKMKEFLYGRMVFDFESKQKEFLVIADAWHPLWKTKANGDYLPIIKTNEIFKGVILPAGKYDITVFFDYSPYLVGIYLSVIFWILFSVGMFLAWKYRSEDF